MFTSYHSYKQCHKQFTYSGTITDFIGWSIVTVFKIMLHAVIVELLLYLYDIAVLMSLLTLISFVAVTNCLLNKWYIFFK